LGFSFGAKKSFQRREPRVKSTHLLRVAPSQNVKPVVCNLVDLSAHGVCFRWNRGFKPGALLNIVINLPEEDCQIPATIKVVWRATFGFWGGYRMGARIVSIAEPHREKIQHFVTSNPLQYA